MGRRLRKADAARMLGVTPGAMVTFIARRKFEEHRDEDGLPRYDEDEIKAFIERENWTGPKNVRARKEYNEETLEIKKARYMVKAIEMILDGKDRLEIFLTLRCPPQWIDRAYVECQQNLESARLRNEEREAREEEERKQREHDKAMKATEKMMRDDIKRRRAKR